MVDSRFAVYLIPPYPLSRDIAEIHRMLQKVYGFKAGGRFQVHATVKGFFKNNSGDLQLLLTGLDDLFQQETSFTVEFNGFRMDPIGLGFDLLELDGKPNQPFLDFRQRVVDAIHPFIAPDCDFADHDLGRPFHPHITLAFKDIAPSMYPEVIDFLKPAPLPKGTFIASIFHFLEFFSDDWEGAWWESLTWKFIKGWKLTP